VEQMRWEQPLNRRMTNHSFAPPAGRTAGDYHQSPNRMAWRPYANLIDGELDNRIPGKVTRWMRFFRRGMNPVRVTFHLAGDFHEDIRGKVIQLKNPSPSDENMQFNRKGTYMEGLNRVQHQAVGDITAGHSLGPWTELAQKLMAQNEHIWDRNGLKETELRTGWKEFPERYRAHSSLRSLLFVAYPYIEWYSDPMATWFWSLILRKWGLSTRVSACKGRRPQRSLSKRKRDA
jgi:hypothetical protein